MPAVAVTGLRKTYANGLTALKDIDLTIDRGEIFALLGPNGAGKTTLINIICGIVTPSAGTVAANGHDIVSRLSRRAPQHRPGSPGAAYRCVRERLGDRHLQPRAVR